MKALGSPQRGIILLVTLVMTVLLTLFALVLDFIVTQVENRLLVWRPTAAETESL